MRARNLCRTAALTAALLTAAAAGAQNVTPMVYELAPSGRGAVQELDFWNSEARPVAIEVTAQRRTFDVDGRAVDHEPAGDIEVVPAQFLAAPGGHQKVRVRYAGPASIEASRSYAISFRQVPIQLGSDPKLRFLFDFRTLANVVPSNAADAIVVESAAADSNGARLVFRNNGTRIGRIDALPLQIRAGERMLIVPTAELRDRYDLRWLMAGAVRIAHIPLDIAPGTPLSAQRWTGGAL